MSLEISEKFCNQIIFDYKIFPFYKTPKSKFLNIVLTLKFCYGDTGNAQKLLWAI